MTHLVILGGLVTHHVVELGHVHRLEVIKHVGRVARSASSQLFPAQRTFVGLTVFGLAEKMPSGTFHRSMLSRLIERPRFDVLESLEMLPLQMA